MKKGHFVQRLERWWWQLFWQLRRQCMPVEVMAGVMADSGQWWACCQRTCRGRPC